MKNKQILLFVFVTLIFVACKKNNDNPSSNNNAIDVSAQDITDFSGNHLKNVADSQWQNRYFTAQEMALFQSLDTANLAGTIMPSSTSQTLFYPNPFTTVARLYFSFNNGYVGQNKLKYVIVDSLMNPQQKGVLTLGTSQSGVQLNFNLQVGRYRIYYTLSALSNEHYYKSWGNIQRSQ